MREAPRLGAFRSFQVTILIENLTGTDLKRCRVLNAEGRPKSEVPEARHPKEFAATWEVLGRASKICWRALAAPESCPV